MENAYIGFLLSLDYRLKRTFDIDSKRRQGRDSMMEKKAKRTESYQIVRASQGMIGFDTDTKITEAANEFVLQGFHFVLRYLSLREKEAQGDLTKEEANAILEAGLGLMPVQHVREPGWIPTEPLGLRDGNEARIQAYTRCDIANRIVLQRYLIIIPCHFDAHRRFFRRICTILLQDKPRYSDTITILNGDQTTIMRLESPSIDDRSTWRGRL